MELHGVSHDVRHFVVPAVVHAFHGVEYAPLHGFEPVLDVWHGTFQDDIRCVVEEPVLVHSAEMVHGGGIEPVHRLVVGVIVCDSILIVFFRTIAESVSTLQFVIVFYFVAHV